MFRFSVIIPLYNKAPYVAKTLQSVFDQTFTDWELIVVNDGSTDNSLQVAAEIIDGVSERFPAGKVNLMSQNNSGVSTARNNGVAASHGEYVCFLDADDWWETTFLEEMDRLITDFPDAGIYGTGYNIINETRHKTRVAPIGVDEGFEKGYINYCKVYSKTLCMPLTSISVAMPRNVFGEMHGFKPFLKLGEDFDLWIRVALKCKVAFLNKSLAYYNQDVDVANRGTHHLHAPENHMLFNLNYLEGEEKKNLGYKQLVDNMRTYGLLSYYISRVYHDAAKLELEKVDWSRQPSFYVELYKRPLFYLRLRQRILSFGSKIKNSIFQR